jgi:hypothetical protein
MFDWLKKREYSNVVKFPEAKAFPIFPDQVPYDDEPAPEKPAVTYYRLGITDNKRVSFQMGYSEITMTKKGVQNLIEQLQVFRDQLADEDE